MEAVQERFKELRRILEAQEALQPGVNNSLYKQFMLLLEEQSSVAGFDLTSMLQSHVSRFFVTDNTSIDQWVEVLSAAYTSVLKELIHRRKSKHRIDIEEVRRFINRSFTEPITLESIAGQFFVSKEHLSRTFKQEFDSTVMDYIITKRIDKAKHLLQDPSVSIKYAAEEVGYMDLTYFHRIFKKITGITPAQVREDDRK